MKRYTDDYGDTWTEVSPGRLVCRSFNSRKEIVDRDYGPPTPVEDEDRVDELQAAVRSVLDSDPGWTTPELKRRVRAVLEGDAYA